MTTEAYSGLNNLTWSDLSAESVRLFCLKLHQSRSDVPLLTAYRRWLQTFFMLCMNVSWPWTPAASQSVLQDLPKIPVIMCDDIDAGKRSERMNAVFQLVKILVGWEKKSLWHCMMAWLAKTAGMSGTNHEHLDNPSLSHTHTHTHTHRHTHTDTHTQTLTHRHSHTDTHTQTLTHRHSHSHSHSLFQSRSPTNGILSLGPHLRSN